MKENRDKSIPEQLENLRKEGAFDDLPEDNVERSQDINVRINEISYDTMEEDIDFFIEQFDSALNNEGTELTNELMEQGYKEVLENPNLTEQEKAEQIKDMSDDYRERSLNVKYNLTNEYGEEAIAKLDKVLSEKFKEIQQKRLKYGIEFEKDEARIYDKSKESYVEVMATRSPEYKRAQELYEKDKEILDDLSRKMEETDDPEQKESLASRIDSIKSDMKIQKERMDDRRDYYSKRLEKLDGLNEEIGKDIEEYNKKKSKLEEFKKYHKINIVGKQKLEETKERGYLYKISQYPNKQENAKDNEEITDESLIPEEDEPIVGNSSDDGKDKDENNHKNTNDSPSNDGKTEKNTGTNNVVNSNSSPQGYNALEQQSNLPINYKKENKLKQLFRKITDKFKRRNNTKISEKVENSPYNENEAVKDKRNFVKELISYVRNDKEYVDNHEFKGFDLSPELVNEFNRTTTKIANDIERHRNMSNMEILKENLQKKAENIQKKVSAKSNKMPEPGIEI